MDGERAPIYLHPASYRFLTHREAAFLDETYELLVTRAHWGLISFDDMSNQWMVDHEMRKTPRDPGPLPLFMHGQRASAAQVASVPAPS